MSEISNLMQHATHFTESFIVYNDNFKQIRMIFCWNMVIENISYAPTLEFIILQVTSHGL